MGLDEKEKEKKLKREGRRERGWRLVATAGFNQEQDACNEITISLHAD